MYERITGENPYKTPDAHLPRRPLHDGRAVGGLRAAVAPSRAASSPARPTSPTTAPTASAPRRSCRAWPTATSCCPTRCPTTSPASSARRVVPTDDPAFVEAEAGRSRDRTDRFLLDRRHPLGRPLPPRARQDHVGQLRHGPQPGGPEKALSEIPALREEFEKDLRLLGSADALNQSLEKAGRVADFFELAELMCSDALHREECCGGHFRLEHQTEDGEARRDDEHFAYVAAWEWTGEGGAPELTRNRSSSSTSTWPRGATSDDVGGQPRPLGRPTLDLKLRIWRQAGPSDARGDWWTYDVPGISEDMSFLEMLDILNDRLMRRGEEPIAFEHDCREGICGSCGMMINGQAHGPQRGTATCQLHMRKFADGDVIDGRAVAGRRLPGGEGPRGQPSRLRPHRRGRRLHQREHRRGARGQHHRRCPRRWPTPPSTPPPASAAAPAWPPAPTAPPSCSPRPSWPTSTCCPRARPSASAASRRWSTRWRSTSARCTNHGECQEACPKSISIDYIALMNRDYVKAKFKNRKLLSQTR